MKDLFSQHPSTTTLNYYPYIQWYIDSMAYVLIRQYNVYKLYADADPEIEFSGFIQTLGIYPINTSELVLRAILFQYNHPLFNPL